MKWLPVWLLWACASAWAYPPIFQADVPDPEAVTCLYENSTAGHVEEFPVTVSTDRGNSAFGYRVCLRSALDWPAGENAVRLAVRAADGRTSAYAEGLIPRPSGDVTSARLAPGATAAPPPPPPPPGPSMALIYAGGLGSGSYTDGLTDYGYQPQNYIYGSHIDIPSSGTVTQMGVYCALSFAGTATLKFGLYTSAGVLVAQSTGTLTELTRVWIDSGPISASVSSGRHYVMVSASVETVRYAWSSAGDGSYATEAHASAMAATEAISGEAESGTLFGVRLDFTAGGGGSASAAPQSPAARLLSILLPNF